jgi:hypothetical protein
MSERQQQWLPFESWLSTLRQGEEGVEELEETSHSPGSEAVVRQEDSGGLPPSRGIPASGSSENADNSTRLHHNQQPRPQPRQQPPSSTLLARDCRTETRLIDGPARGRQSLTIMLAAPGMPLSKCPLITARQAASLLTALCEPLIQLPVGRLTRRLEAPTLLVPTEERGTISLWLLPNDDVSLVWQGPAAQGSGKAGKLSDCQNETQESESQLESESLVWEELACFPSGQHPGNHESMVVVHMLRGDSTGRSFYIKPRLEGILGNSALLEMASAAPDTNNANTTLTDPLNEEEDGRRMYFWLLDNDVNCAVHKLGRLKSMIKRPPTLSKRACVSQGQLQEIAQWLMHVENITSSSSSSGGGSGEGLEREQEQGRSDGSARMASLMSRYKRPGLTARESSGRGEPQCTVSATAAAVYRDRRFQVSVPCTVTVATSVGAQTLSSVNGMAPLEGSGSNQPSSHPMFSQSMLTARETAEELARSTVDRLGRQRLEEAICESLIRAARVYRTAKSKVRGPVAISSSISSSRGTSKDQIGQGNRRSPSGAKDEVDCAPAVMGKGKRPKKDDTAASPASDQVTVDNLQSLLSTSSFEKQEQEKGGKDVESGPAPSIPGDKINVTDLQELIQYSEWDVD